MTANLCVTNTHSLFQHMLKIIQILSIHEVQKSSEDYDVDEDFQLQTC